MVSSVKSPLLVVVPIALCYLALISQAATAPATNGQRKPKADSTTGQNCTDHMNVIDKCASQATYSYSSAINQYPQIKEDLKSSCNRISDGIKCLKTYSKCLTNIPRRALVAFQGARSKHSKRICANFGDQRSADFLRSCQCIKQKGKFPRMLGHEKDLISMLQFLAVNTTYTWEQRFHGACCAAEIYRTKVFRDIEPECSQDKNAIEEMFNSMVGEVLEVACPEDARLAELCTKLPKFPKTIYKSGSLTGAALELIVNLEDNKDEKKT